MNKILIVDDEQDILEFLSYNFRKHNFAVVTAMDGEEGVIKAKQEIPNIILSDILMPLMDGITMCGEIKKNESLSTIPFIFLTAVNDDYKVLHAMSAGANQFVSKPIRFEYLLKIVNQTLKPA
jgi:two-component system, OmpR family, alkaline phosphatase synthesis response regulator PhoP